MGDMAWKNIPTLGDHFPTIHEQRAAAPPEETSTTMNRVLADNGSSRRISDSQDDNYEPVATLRSPSASTLDGARLVVGGMRYYPQGDNGRETESHYFGIQEKLGNKGFFYELGTDYNGPFDGKKITSLGAGLELDPLRLPVMHDVRPYISAGLEYGYGDNVSPDASIINNAVVTYTKIGATTPISGDFLLDVNFKSVPKGKGSDKFDVAGQVALQYKL